MAAEASGTFFLNCPVETGDGILMKCESGSSQHVHSHIGFFDESLFSPREQLTCRNATLQSVMSGSSTILYGFD